jgi:hypothetical protein
MGRARRFQPGPWARARTRPTCMEAHAADRKCGSVHRACLLLRRRHPSTACFGSMISRVQEAHLGCVAPKGSRPLTTQSQRLPALLCAGAMRVCDKMSRSQARLLLHCAGQIAAPAKLLRAAPQVCTRNDCANRVSASVRQQLRAAHAVSWRRRRLAGAHAAPRRSHRALQLGAAAALLLLQRCACQSFRVWLFTPSLVATSGA